MHQRVKHSFSFSLRILAGFFNFRQYSIIKQFNKCIALLLVLTFSYSQILFAVDVSSLRQMLADAKAQFDVWDEGGAIALSAAQLEANQDAAESEVEQQQALQELQGLQFNLTTENGDILNYLGDALTGIERPDGTKLLGVELDEDNNILNAALSLPDGSTLIVQNGKVVGLRRPDGREEFFNETTGLTEVSISKEGVETTHTYSDTNIVLDNINFTQTYNLEGILLTSVNKQTQATTDFENGLIDKITLQDLSVFEFKQTVVGEDVQIELDTYQDVDSNKHFYDANGNLSQILLQDNTVLTNVVMSSDGTSLLDAVLEDDLGNILITSIATDSSFGVPAIFTQDFIQDHNPFQSALYRSVDSSLKEVLTHDSQTIFFNEEGLLTQVLDAQGIVTDFDFAQSALSFLTQTTITQNNVASSYNAQGNLLSLNIEGTTIHYAQDENDETVVHYLQTQEGSEIYDIQAADDGSIQNATIYDTEGYVETYEAGSLVSRVLPNLDELFYVNDELTQVQTHDELVYNVTQTPTDIEFALDSSFIPDALTITKMVYDAADNSLKTIEENNRILSYFDNKLVNIVFLDGQAPQDITHNVDGTYLVTQGATQMLFDANDNPLEATISPTEENPHTLHVTYQYGKIREVTKDGILTFTYAYTFENGEEFTQIDDLEENHTKVYNAQGDLLTDLESDTNLLSTFSYADDNKVSQVEVTRFGRFFHAYTYSYEGDFTLITDEAGVTRTYDADQKLIFREEGPVLYGYTYHLNDEGQEIVQEMLTQETLAGGAIAHFSEGNITQIDLEDGSYLTDIVFDEERQIKEARITLLSGVQKVFNDKALLEEILPDGSHFFFEKSRISKIITPLGEEFSYDYVSPPNSSLELYDKSSNLHPLTFHGGAQTDLTDTHNLPASLLLDGYDDYVALDDSDDFHFGTSDFSLETYIKWDEAPQAGEHLLSQFQDTENYWALYFGGGSAFQFQKNDSAGPANKEIIWSPTLGAWHKLKVERQANTLSFTIDDVLIEAFDYTGVDLQNLGVPVTIGQRGDDTGFLNARLEGLELTSQDQVKLTLAPGDDKELIQYIDVTHNETVYRYTSSGESVSTLDDFMVQADPLSHLNSMDFTQDFGDGTTGTYEFGNLKEVSQGTTLYQYATYLLGDGSQTLVQVGDYEYSFDAEGLLNGFILDNDFYQKTNEVNVFADESTGQHTHTLHGNPEINPQGVHLDGAGDSIAFEDSGDFHLGEGDFTIDFQIRWNQPPQSNQYLLSQYDDSSNFWAIYYGDGGVLQFQKKDGLDNTNKEFFWTPQTGQWHHLSFAREGSTLKFFIDGQLLGSTGYSGVNFADLASDLTLGQRGDGQGFFDVSFNNVRISKGIARFGDSFTPPTAIASDEYTSLLFHEHQRQIEGDAYQSANGYIAFDATGNIVDQFLSEEGAELGAFLANPDVSTEELPYKDSLNYLSLLNPDIPTWFDIATSATPKSQTIMTQEYSFLGILETQTKGDRTTTLFNEFNKPTHVTNQDTGEIILEYEYDLNQKLTGVNLRSARDALPDRVRQARLSIEEQKANALRDLAAERQLAYEQIQIDVQVQRDILQGQYSDLQTQYSDISGLEARGQAAKAAKGSALGEINGALTQVEEALILLAHQEAEAYAGLDSEVLALATQIDADSDVAFQELQSQETALQQEIIRQEISPLIYEYYRQILGRDPSSAEYESWVSQIDYETGELIIGETSHEEVIPGASVYLDGAGDYLVVEDSDDWYFDQGDFTLDFWFKPNGALGEGQHLLSQYDDSNNFWSLFYGGGGVLQFYKKDSFGNINKEVPYSFTADTWSHFAVVRDGSNLRLFANGQIITTWDYTGVTLGNTAGNLYIGQKGNNSGFFNGYFDKIRITKGEALWQDNFTAPTEYLQSVTANTKLLFAPKDQEIPPAEDLSGNDYFILNSGDVYTDTTQSATQDTITIVDLITAPVAQAIEDSLLNSQELLDRQAYVQNIKSEVGAFFALSETDQDSYIATSLGLTSSDLIPLSSTDITAILAWIDSQGLHFGQSAFLSLEELLDQKGISYAREDIAKRAILIDILTGVITPLDDGDLVLSFFALQKTAELHGLNLFGANVSFEDLLSLYIQTPDAKLITHINGNHMVVVTGITEDSIAYMDTGIGADKQNENVSLSKEEFQKRWQGNVLLEDAHYTTIETQTTTQARLLTENETKNIRGAFFGLIFAAAAFIGSIATGIGTTIAGILASIGGILSAVGSIVHGALLGITQGLGSILSTVGNLATTLFQGIQFAASTLFNAGQGLFATLSSQASFGNLADLTFGGSFFENAISVGLNFAINRGFDGLGFNTGGLFDITQAFSTGGIAISFLPAQAFSFGSVFTSLLSTALNFGTQTLIESLDLTPALSQVASLIASPIIGGIQQGNVAGQTVTIFNEIGQNLAFYGLREAGESFGLSPQVATLIGTPIAASIGTGINQGQLFGEQILESVEQGLIAGAIGYAAEYAVEELPLPRVVRDFATNVLANSLLNLTDTSLPRSDLPSAIINSAIQAGRNLFMPANLTQLVTAVSTLGFKDGLEAYASSVFERGTIEAILASSENLAEFINERLAQAEPVIFDDKDAKLVSFSKDGTVFQILYEETVDGINILGYMENDTFYRWQNGVSPNANSSISTYLDDGTSITRYITDGITELIEFKDQEGNLLAKVYPGSEGSLGKIENLQTDMTLTFKDQNRVELSYTNQAGAIDHQDIINLTTLSQDKRDELTALLLGFGNGFSNESEEGALPGIITGFINDLKEDGALAGNAVFGTTLYEQTSLLKNMWDWTRGAFFGSDVLTSEVETEFDTYWNSLTLEQQESRVVYFTHSGHFKPLTQVLETRQDIPIHTLFNFEGPYVGDNVIDNPNLQRLININGTAPPIPLKVPFLRVETASLLVDYQQPEIGLIVQQDTVDIGDHLVPFLGTHSFQGIENYNFEILGARHGDYSYDPSQYPTDAEGLVAHVKEVNRKVNIIVRDMYRAALNDEFWQGFVDRPDVRYDATRDIYVIDPLEYVEENL